MVIDLPFKASKLRPTSLVELQVPSQWHKQFKCLRARLQVHLLQDTIPLVINIKFIFLAGQVVGEKRAAAIVLVSPKKSKKGKKKQKVVEDEITLDEDSD
jgi:hypothetical protein